MSGQGEMTMLNESPVLAFLNKMTDLIVLNLLFLVCCVPVVTIGPALTALYAVSLRSVRYGDGYVVSTFWKSFKQNFRQSFVAGILMLFAAVLLFADVWFWSNMDLGILAKGMLVVSISIAFLVLIVFLWLFPVLAKIENGLWANLKNAAAMAVGHFFPYTFCCALITLAGAYMIYSSMVADIVFVLLGAALFAYVKAFFYYKVFAKYMDETPAAEDDPLYGSSVGNRQGDL